MDWSNNNYKNTHIGFELTTSKKKSTCGRLCTKNRTGCRSIVTLTVKSCGVPGLTVFRGIASWCEWINVSSKSNTNVFRCTILRRCLDTGDNGNKSYFTGWYWTNCGRKKNERKKWREKRFRLVSLGCVILLCHYFHLSLKIDMRVMCICGSN